MFIGMRDVILDRLGLPDPYAYLERMGVDAVEVRVQPDLTLDAFHPLPDETLTVADETGVQRVLQVAESVGVRIGAVLLLTDYDAPDLDEQQHARWMRASLRLAQAADAAAVRIDVRPHGRGEPGSEDAFLERVSPRLEADLALAREYHVPLAVENHGAFTNRPAFLERLLSRFAGAGLGVTLDSGNFYCTGGLPISEIQDTIRQFASRTLHVHVKNIAYPDDACDVPGHRGLPYAEHARPIDMGDIDHAVVLADLARAGYAEGIYIEDESLGRFPPAQQVENITREIGYLWGILDTLDTVLSRWSEGQERWDPFEREADAPETEMDESEPEPGIVRLRELPRSVEDYVSLQQSLARTPEGGAAMMVLALLLYVEDQDLGQACLTQAVDEKHLRDRRRGGGEQRLRVRDAQLIRSQLQAHPHIPRSYLVGATPDNGYRLPDPPLAVRFAENPYAGSPDSGRVKAFVVSSGADSPRPVTVQRDARGIWRAWEWSSLLLGIRAGL